MYPKFVSTTNLYTCTQYIMSYMYLHVVVFCSFFGSASFSVVTVADSEV